jgi:hypothetical protein
MRQGEFLTGELTSKETDRETSHINEHCDDITISLISMSICDGRQKDTRKKWFITSAISLWK